MSRPFCCIEEFVTKEKSAEKSRVEDLHTSSGEETGILSIKVEAHGQRLSGLMKSATHTESGRNTRIEMLFWASSNFQQNVDSFSFYY